MLFIIHTYRGKTLERQIFYFLCVLGLFCTALIFSLDLFIYHPRLRSYVVETIAIIGFGTFGYLSSKSNVFDRLLIPMCVFLLTIADAGWYAGGGSISPANMLTFCVVISASIALLSKNKWVYYIPLTIVNMLLVFACDYFFGKLIFGTKYPLPAEIFYNDLSFTIIMSAQIWLVTFLKDKYDEEREVLKESFKMLEESKREIESQNEELTQQNEEINSQREEIENYNIRLIEKADQLNKAIDKISDYNLNLTKLVSERTHEIRLLHNELDMLFYRSSHDFRGPLMSLQGLAAVSKFTPDDQPLLWQKVDSIVENLDQMIRKFVMISEINQFEITKAEPVNIHDALNDVLSDFSSKLSDFHINIDIHLKTYNVNDSRNKLLKIVFYNLIENAIHYKKSITDNELLIKIIESESSVILSVFDNGCGIDPNVVDKVTNMYYRGNKNSQGHGLGLYVVNAAMKKLKGSLLINSTLFDHTLVTIRFDSNPLLL